MPRYTYAMRDLAEIRKDTEDIMSRPATTGQPKDEQIRRLLANSVEASALVHDQVSDFKTRVDRYAEYTERNERTTKIVTYTSIAISVLATLFGIWSTIQSSRSDAVWQDKQLHLLEQISKELKT